MRAVVFAYNNIGCEGIEALLKNGFEIAAVFTHKDDPNENLWFRSVAQLAAEKGIPVYAPENPNHPLWISRIKKMKPDYLFSFYYREIIGKEILAIPSKGALNLHGSLLPKYRGASPITSAVLNGERESGVSFMHMDKGLDTGVFERGAGKNRSNGPCERGPSQGCADEGLVHASCKIGLEKLLVLVGHEIEHVVPGFLGLCCHVRGKLVLLDGAALVLWAEGEILHGNKVYDTLKAVTCSPGKDNGHGIGAKTRLHGLEAGLEIGARPVHLVHKGDLRHPELLGLAPHGLGLGLHAGHSAKDAHCPVQHPKAALHLDGKVHVPWRVDEVYLVILPQAGGAGRGNGDAPLLLLGHEVHGGRAVVHLAHAVDLAGVEENALRERGLARVNVRYDAYVAKFAKVHVSFPLCLLSSFRGVPQGPFHACLAACYSPSLVPKPTLWARKKLLPRPWCSQKPSQPGARANGAMPSEKGVWVLARQWFCTASPEA